MAAHYGGLTQNTLSFLFYSWAWSVLSTVVKLLNIQSSGRWNESHWRSYYVTPILGFSFYKLIYGNIPVYIQKTPCMKYFVLYIIPMVHSGVQMITSTDILMQMYLTTGSYPDDVIKWSHFPRSWPFVRGIHRSPVNSPHQGQWPALMFSLIRAWIHGWVNNGEAVDLRRHRAHNDVTEMIMLLILVYLSFFFLKLP